MLRIFFLIIFLVLQSCGNIKKSQIVDNEFKFNYRGQVNLYSSNDKKNIIKKFYKFSNDENLARLNVKTICLDYIKVNNLNHVRCKYMGTHPTEKILTTLN
jgi:hypothetical protein|tara:strand:+ start:62 stop:364 length:303 start_codon:yes stop_codon:yes gene_type:complete